jgi:hypothetical protein
VISDEGANCNWLMEAWRRAGYTPFNESAIAAKAAALGLRAPAVMIAPRLASKSGVLPLLSSSSPSSSLSQPTTRITASHAASARKTRITAIHAAPLAVRSSAAASSPLSSSSSIDAALRAQHNRKPFESLYVTGQCYFEAQAVSNKLTD